MQSEQSSESVGRRKRVLIWPFAVELYQADGMKRICLLLQDNYHINVNLLLWAIWLDHMQRPVEAELLQLADRRIAVWHGRVIVPLRRLRRVLPKVYGCQWLRNRLANLEIRAEKKELQMLQRLANQYWQGPQELQRQKLPTYLQLVLENVPEHYLAEVTQIYLSLMAR